jgi:transposase-like protein
MEHTKNTAKPQSVKLIGVAWPGHCLQDFSAKFLDEDKCIRWILSRLHPDNAYCPSCGTIILDSQRLQHFWGCERLKCKQCGVFFTALTDTIFSGSHMSLREVYLMMLLIAAGFKNRTIAEKLNISNESVRLWRSKFRVWAKHEEQQER